MQVKLLFIIAILAVILFFLIKRSQYPQNMRVAYWGITTLCIIKFIYLLNYHNLMFSLYKGISYFFLGILEFIIDIYLILFIYSTYKVLIREYKQTATNSNLLITIITVFLLPIITCLNISGIYKNSHLDSDIGSILTIIGCLIIQFAILLYCYKDKRKYGFAFAILFTVVSSTLFFFLFNLIVSSILFFFVYIILYIAGLALNITLTNPFPPSVPPGGGGISTCRYYQNGNCVYHISPTGCQYDGQGEKCSIPK